MDQKTIEAKKIVKEYADNLSKNIKVDRVILFGSAARNQMGPNSDIDIVVISPDFKKMNFLKRLELLSISRTGDAEKEAMDILGYTADEFDKMSKVSVVLGEAKKEGKIVWNQ